MGALGGTGLGITYLSHTKLCSHLTSEIKPGLEYLPYLPYKKLRQPSPAFSADSGGTMSPQMAACSTACQELQAAPRGLFDAKTA